MSASETDFDEWKEHKTSNRKRRRDSDDEELTIKKRFEEDPEKVAIDIKLFELIVNVEVKSTSSIESDLESLAQVLETDLDTYKDRVIEIIVRCVTCMPRKLTIYSTLVGLLNAKKYSFGNELLAYVINELTRYMQRNNFKRSLYIIIFLSDLVNARVVSIDSFVKFLSDLLETALEDDIPQVRSDWFIYSVLHCLPWVGYELNGKNGEFIENIFQTIVNRLCLRTKEHVKVLRVWASTVHEQEDYIDCLWTQINKLRDDGWKEKHILRHYLLFDGALADALQHDLPRLTVPKHTENSKYPLPTVIFRLFDNADCTDDDTILPDAHSIERFLMEQEINWLIDECKTSKKECGSQLLNFPKKTQMPINYVILEVIFSQMFRLPESPVTPLFYGSLLIELCKTKTMPKVVAQAAEMLYQRIDSMHLICLDRMIDWFSFHMSNFEYRWSWNDWVDCLHLDPLAPKIFFLSEVIEKCIRFSYRERIIKAVGTEFHVVIPEQAEICYELPEDDRHLIDLSANIENAFRTKMSAEDMIELLRVEYENDQVKCVVTFFSVLLNLARKTFSHNFAALSRYYDTLKFLVNTNEDIQLVLLKTLYDLWKKHHQMITVIISKLLKMSLIEGSVVITWIFSESMKPELDKLWAWELITLTLDHVKYHYTKRKMDLKNMILTKNNPSVQEVNMESTEELIEKMEVESEEKPPENGEEGEHRVDVNTVQTEEEKVAELKECLRNLLLNVLHKFTVLLTEHIVNSEASGSNVDTSWYRYTVGRFRSVFLRYEEQVFEMKNSLETELFNPSQIDENIMEHFKQFLSLQQ